MKPIFLISLPRSGSTLLQKILMSNDKICSSAENWFLLPLIYTMKDKGIKTEYGHKSSIIALNYLQKNYFNDKEIYKKEIKNFALNLYKNIKCEKNVKYFLDKTPRYYWILDELNDIFEKPKFIFLLRNPISVFASTIEAFHNNSIKRLDYAYNDFYIGPKKISEFLEKNQNETNIYITSYEKIVLNPNDEIKNICKFLDIEFQENMLNSFYKTDIKGYGDHLGAKKFKKIENNTEKWKKIINNRLRKQILREYLRKYDDIYIKFLGENKEKLLDKVYKYNPNNLFSCDDLKNYVEYKTFEKIKLIIKYESLN